LDDDDDGDGILDFLEEEAEAGELYEKETEPAEAPSEEAEIDTDGDGIPDSIDEDDDNDGIPDYLDEDDDGDGILDLLEGVSDEVSVFDQYFAPDTYAELRQPVDESPLLFVDFAEPAADVKPVADVNKSVTPKVEPVFLADNLIHVGINIDMESDVDGDGIPDYRDDDDDNDGIPDHLDMDTEVLPIHLRLVNGPKVKFNGEEDLSVLLRRSQGQDHEQEQQNTMFSGIFSKAMKTISGTSAAEDDSPISPSPDADRSSVSMFTSVFDSFKKSILEEDEDDSEQDGKHETEDVAYDSESEPVVNPKPTVTEMISDFFANLANSKSDSSRHKGR